MRRCSCGVLLISETPKCATLLFERPSYCNRQHKDELVQQRNNFTIVRVVEITEVLHTYRCDKRTKLSERGNNEFSGTTTDVSEVLSDSPSKINLK